MLSQELGCCAWLLAASGTGYKSFINISGTALFIRKKSSKVWVL